MDDDRRTLEFKRFVEIVARLRDPQGGCPWDLEQTHESLRPYLLEEAYEVLEAIESLDDAELCSELGDLLLQVVLHAQLAADRGAFTIADVVKAVADKMVRRHPHVFSEIEVSGTKEVLKNWEQIKLAERSAKSPDSARPSLLAGVPKALPALLRAQRLGEKAAKVRFDWDDLSGVLAKVDEELRELQAELDVHSGNPTERFEEELGDLLFALCQLSRWCGVSAEDALHKSSSKFASRFRKMEELAPDALSNLDSEELERLWVRSKSEKGT